MLPGRRDEECARLPKDWTLSRLRWVTLGEALSLLHTCSVILQSHVGSRLALRSGGQYDWTKRAYPPVGASPPFPPQLAILGRAIAEACGFGSPPFCAEAGIVNFYPVRAVHVTGLASSGLLRFDARVVSLQEGAMMGGHRDDAESNFSCPVISISIGAPCVFLLGKVYMCHVR